MVFRRRARPSGLGVAAVDSHPSDGLGPLLPSVAGQGDWKSFLRAVSFAMSHELRTPLAVIDSCAQLLDRRAETIVPDELHARAAKLRRAVSRATNFLGGLAATSENSSAFDAGWVDVEQLLHGILTQVLPQGCHRVAMPDNVALMAEAAAVSAIVGNVLPNASAFPAAEMEVSVDVSIVDDRVKFLIASQGSDGVSSCGLSVANVLAALFGGSVDGVCERGGRKVTIDLPLDVCPGYPTICIRRMVL